MEAVLKSDVFFFITGIAVVVLTIVFVVALYYVVKILRDVRDISRTVKDESKRIVRDIDDARTSIKKKGSRIGSIISSFVPKKKRSKTRKTSSRT